MRYQPGLDALRALCVTAVFVYHAGFFNGGWIGVQIFFVLSGYLITGILLDSLRDGPGAMEYFGNFYLRRALRIFPVYFVYLAIVMLFARPALAPFGNMVSQDSSRDLPWLVTYTYNLYKAFHPATDNGVFFGHLWTLSVEEQFYLVWPLLLYCLDRRRLVLVCLGIATTAPLLRSIEAVWQWHGGPHAREFAGRFVYLLTPSHLDAFALGALISMRHASDVAARVVDWIARHALWIAVLLGGWMILLARIARYPVETSSLGWPPNLPYYAAYTWGFSALNCVAVSLIVNIERLPRFLNSAPVRRLGRVSYGFYLLHFTTLWAAALITGVRDSPTIPFRLAVTALAFGATWLLAEISFRFLETPFLRLKRRFPLAGEKAPANQAFES